MEMWKIILYMIASISAAFSKTVLQFRRPRKIVPQSVNYHFTRICNYSCGFCFHTAKDSHIESLEKAKEGLKLLKENGMRKINFAGGEPFTKPTFLGELVQYCKEELQLESVSIVSNGSLIKENWFEQYGEYLDILAISCDSFNEETNIKIGRGKGQHLKSVQTVKDWCDKYQIKFKLNTVVNAYNYNEDMNQHIEILKPFRWKCFQVLLLDGENNGSEALRNAKQFQISDEQFESFCRLHKNQKCLVPESNKNMQNSYLILDEYMRFLNCTNNGKAPSQSLLEVGVQEALKQSGFDSETFVKRGGIYDWSKPPACSTAVDKKYDW